MRFTRTFTRVVCGIGLALGGCGPKATPREVGLDFVECLRREDYFAANKHLHIVEDNWYSPEVKTDPEGEWLRSFTPEYAFRFDAKSSPKPICDPKYLDKFQSFLETEQIRSLPWHLQLLFMNNEQMLPSIKKDIEKHPQKFHGAYTGMCSMLFVKKLGKWKIVNFDGIEDYRKRTLPSEEETTQFLEKQLSKIDHSKYARLEEQAQEFLQKILAKNPDDLEIWSDHEKTIYHDKTIRVNDHGEFLYNGNAEADVIIISKRHYKIILGQTYQSEDGGIRHKKHPEHYPLYFNTRFRHVRWRGVRIVEVANYRVRLGYVRDRGKYSVLYMGEPTGHFLEQIDKKEMKKYSKIIRTLQKKYPLRLREEKHK